MNNDNISMIAKIVADEVAKTKAPASINLEMAKKLIAKVEDKAREMGVNAVVAVADAHARPVAVECMDNSYIASYDVAFNKAYTVVALKMSTIALKPLSQPGASLYGIQFTNEGKIVIFGGGDPLIYNSQIIGGLGVSGGTEEQDTALSAYGAQCLKEIIEQ
ncbi:MAG: heme-binding protein [Ruminococcaceae bacterium]|nr:heme-binding protein [Oscillospiraceae bacterium]